MKAVHFIGFVVLISMSGFSDFILKNDLDRDNLNGLVKRVTTHSYYAMIDSGRIKKTDTSYFYNKHISNYNINGDCVEKYIYHKDEVFKSKIIYKHDKKGNKIEEFHYYAKDSLKHRKIFVYNKKGLHSNTTTFNGKDELISRDEATYDDSGMYECEVKKFDSKGKFTGNWKYKRSENLDKMEVKHFNSKNKLVEAWVYIYNDNGNLIELNSSYLKHKQSSKLVYEYTSEDSFNNWTRRVQTNINKDEKYKKIRNRNMKKNGISDTTYTIQIRKIEYYK